MSDPGKVLAWVSALVLLCLGRITTAQSPNAHFLQDGYAPPGAVGAAQLARGGPLHAYFQPVELQGPEGSQVALAAEGDFLEPVEGPVNVGLLIGAVYRLRVTGIPGAEEGEVYPSIEVIDRLYPPAGQERRFAIPVELSQEDLQLALAGNFVTRVIYLEDPGTALPLDDAEATAAYDAGPSADPLEVADRLGRPVAILRLGGRLPDDHAPPDDRFLHGCPPFSIFRPYDEPLPEDEALPDEAAADAEPTADRMSGGRSAFGAARDQIPSTDSETRS